MKADTCIGFEEKCSIGCVHTFLSLCLSVPHHHGKADVKISKYNIVVALMNDKFIISVSVMLRHARKWMPEHCELPDMRALCISFAKSAAQYHKCSQLVGTKIMILLTKIVIIIIHITYR